IRSDGWSLGGVGGGRLPRRCFGRVVGVAPSGICRTVTKKVASTLGSTAADRYTGGAEVAAHPLREPERMMSYRATAAMMTRWTGVVALLAMGVSVAAFGAPAPSGKIKPADQWEYGELHYNGGAVWGQPGGAPMPGG